MIKRKREKKSDCVGGNSVDFLCDGDEFFPRLLKRIRNAKYEIVIETFIFGDDRIGRLMTKALVKAARRGVWVAITADGWGSYHLPEHYIEELAGAGVNIQFFDPQPDWLPYRPKLFRRLHRKLAVIDGRYGYVGGINLCADHLSRNVDIFKKDYAVEITGPIVLQIRSFCMNYICESTSTPLPEKVLSEVRQSKPGPTSMAFLQRDNANNTRTIERAYIEAINNAKAEVFIANAYFFPGYRVMRALRKAAERGVDVRIIVQGNPDIDISLKAARSLYTGLTQAGVKVYEYKETALHAKIAAIDDKWTCIGSSNLDPWSLSFNLEANVVCVDSVMNKKVKEQMYALMSESDIIKKENWIKGRAFWQHFKDTVVFHFFRLVPAIINSLPVWKPKVRVFTDRIERKTDASYDARKQASHPESQFVRRLTSKKDVTL